MNAAAADSAPMAVSSAGSASCWPAPEVAEAVTPSLCVVSSCAPPSVLPQYVVPLSPTFGTRGPDSTPAVVLTSPKLWPCRTRQRSSWPSASASQSPSNSEGIWGPRTSQMWPNKSDGVEPATGSTAVKDPLTVLLPPLAASIGASRIAAAPAGNNRATCARCTVGSPMANPGTQNACAARSGGSL